MEQIKWPFLKQTWGIEFERSKGAYLYTKDGRKFRCNGDINNIDMEGKKSLRLFPER